MPGFRDISDSSRAGDLSALDVYLLGVVDFDAALAVQECLVREVQEHAGRGGALLLCEHPPLLVMGREASREHLLCDESELRSREIEVRWVNRGGGAVLHTPGQLAIYPVVPVEAAGLSAADFPYRLSRVLAEVCREMRIPAWTNDVLPGVWCRGGQVAQIGCGIRDGITRHGAVLNVSPRMDLQRWIRTPSGCRVTSLCVERMSTLAMARIRECVVRKFMREFDFSQCHPYTGHPLLRRTRRVIARV